MKLIYICADLGIPILGNKGAAVHLRSLVDAFSRQQHNVVVTAPALNKSPWEEPAKLNASLLHVPPNDEIKDSALAMKSYNQLLEQANSVPGEVRRILYDQQLRTRLTRRFDCEPPDFIYERLSLYSTVGVTLSQALNRPLIVEMNSPLTSEQTTYRGNGLGDLAVEAESWTLRNADAVVVVSETLREIVLARGVDSHRVHVMANGVTSSIFHPDANGVNARETWKLGEHPILGFVGGLRPWHGVEVLPELLQRLQGSVPGIRMAIVGDGPLRERLEADFAERSLSHLVTFTGAVSHDKVAPLIRAFDVAVAPYPQLSHDFYFSPLKLFEYMACGVPVVVPQVGQIEELVTHEETGLLYECGNLNELTSSCERLFRDSTLRRELGARASTLIRSNYTWDRNSERVIELARGLLQNDTSNGQTNKEKKANDRFDSRLSDMRPHVMAKVMPRITSKDGSAERDISKGDSPEKTVKSSDLRSANESASEPPTSKVAYVVKRYPRYSETFIVNEILAHESAGLSIEIFSLLPCVDTHFQDSLAKVQAPVHYLPNKVWKAGEFWLQLQKAADELPGGFAALDGTQALSARELVQALHLAREALRGECTHFHAHFATSAVSVVQLASRLSGIPYSFTAHANDIFHESVDRAVLRKKFADAAASVTVSDFNLRWLNDEFGASVSTLRRIYNGMNLERFEFHDEPQRRPMVLAVGRLVEKKGFDDLIDACKLLRDRNIKFECIVVGEGEQEAELRGKINDLNLESFVKFAGARPQSEVIQLVREAAIFVAPCKIGKDGNRDGLPTVLLEAMALGTACVSTKVTGIPEAVVHHETGILTDPEDVPALADALQLLLSDVDLRSNLVRGARRLIEREFDVVKNTRQLREIFNHEATRATIRSMEMTR